MEGPVGRVSGFPIASNCSPKRTGMKKRLQPLFRQIQCVHLSVVKSSSVVE